MSRWQQFRTTWAPRPWDAATHSQPAATNLPLGRLAVVLACAFLMLQVLRFAWVSDDIFLTLRTLDNFHAGHGLRWNVAERVQAYTHPLWMLLLLPLYGWSREPFYTVIAAGAGTTLLTLLVLITALRRQPWSAAVLLLLLGLSPSFVDYATSGLENPLSHLLLALFFLYAMSPAWTAAQSAIAVMLASLLLLTRADHLWLVAPPLALKLTQAVRAVPTPPERWRIARFALLALWPLLLWGVFSFVYYGFVLPNTAYAKLKSGIPTVQLWTQGLGYWLSTALWDPAGVLLLLTAMVTPWVLRCHALQPWSIGLMLHVVYVCSVAGDFMVGRFLTLPLLTSLLVLQRCVQRSAGVPHAAAWLSLSVGLVALSAPHCPPLRHPLAKPKRIIDQRGVGNERAWYAAESSLAAASRERIMPFFPYFLEGQAARGSAELDGRRVVVRDTVGMYGYGAGPKIHIVDSVALGDPLLSKLPAARRYNWRVGHYLRAMPAGYLESIENNDNRIQDKTLHAYYDALRTVIRGPIFDAQRVLLALKLNLGLLPPYKSALPYRYPDRVKVPLRQLDHNFVPGSRWDAQVNVPFGESGLWAYSDRPEHVTHLELSLDGQDAYVVIFRYRGQERARTALSSYRRDGMTLYRTEVPKAARRLGFDALHILPREGDGHYALGHLRLLQSGP
ncbi:MAG: hypothetical protein ACPGUV_06345 [Polyangiales bacterium]